MIKRNQIKCTRFLLADQNSKVTKEFTAAALNKLDGIAVTAAEYSLMDNMWASVATTAVDGTDGTATVQFVFSDTAGVTMATPVVGEFYISEVATGLTVDALDNSLAALTNGAITLLDTGVLKHWNFVTSAAGLLGLTVTSNADNYWVIFKHPTGTLVPSGQITISG